MISPVPPDAGPTRDYYRRNFLSFLDFVHDLYSDLLTDHEGSYITTLNALSFDAQCLYIRLVCRVGPVFRNDKIAYDEITDISVAAKELAHHDLLLIDGDYEAAQILRLLLKDEVLEMIEKLDLPVPAPAGKKKAALLEAVLPNDDDGSIGDYRKGLFTTYENYPLERNARPFKDRQTINERIHLHTMSEELFESLRELEGTEIPDCEAIRSNLYRYGSAARTSWYASRCSRALLTNQSSTLQRASSQNPLRPGCNRRCGKDMHGDHRRPLE